MPPSPSRSAARPGPARPAAHPALRPTAPSPPSPAARPGPARPGPDPHANVHAPDLERAVLGVVLAGHHPHAWATVHDLVPHLAAWYQRDHRIIVLACHHLAAANTPIDVLSVIDALRQLPFATVADALARADREDFPALAPAPRTRAPMSACPSGEDALAAVGGEAALHRLLDAHAPASGLAINCRRLADHYRQRRAAAVLDDLRQRCAAVGGREHLDRLLDDAVAHCARLRAGAVDAAATLSAAGALALADHDRARADPADRRAAWGLPALDAACPLAPGRLVTLAAPPGCGKTSLALQAALATVAARGPGAAAIASLEMPAAELAAILIARDIGASRAALETGRLTDVQRAQAAAAVARWREADCFLRDAAAGGGAGATADAVCAWARHRHAASGGALALVVVDYLQLLDGHPGQSEYERLSHATRALKQLAVAERICVLALSQFNRDGRRANRDRHGHLATIPEPRAEDLRGSGTIEQDSDALLLLWPATPARPAILPMHAKLEKNRGGDCPRLLLHFHRADGQLFTSSPDGRVADSGSGSAGDVTGVWGSPRSSNQGPSARGARWVRPPGPHEDAFQRHEPSGPSSHPSHPSL